MEVHLSGTALLPGCPNYGLNIAAQGPGRFTEVSIHVDDALMSVFTDDKAIQLVLVSYASTNSFLTANGCLHSRRRPC